MLLVRFKKGEEIKLHYNKFGSNNYFSDYNPENN